MNQELIQYIQQALAQGDTKENIITALKTGGWGEEDIEEGFHSVEALAETPMETPIEAIVKTKQEEVQPTQPIEGRGKSMKALVLVGVLILTAGLFIYFLPNVKTLFVTDNSNVEETSTTTLETVLPKEVLEIATSTTSTSSDLVEKEEVVQKTSSTTPVKKETTKPTEKTVVQTEIATTSPIKNITPSTPGDDWKEIEIASFFSTILMPGQDISVESDESFFGQSYVRVFNNLVEYSFVEALEGYEALLYNFQKGPVKQDNLEIQRVVFKTKQGNDINAYCAKETDKSLEVCLAFFKKYDGKALVIRCESRDGKSCAVNNNFYSVVFSLFVTPPPFVGVLGLEVSDIIKGGTNIALPEGVIKGFLILDTDSIKEVNVFGIEGLPIECESGVCDGSPAKKAGLKSGDILLKVNEIDIIDFEKAFESFKQGDTVSVTYLRDGKEAVVKLDFITWPNYF